MPLNPIAPFVKNWETRLQVAQQAGIPEQAFAPVFNMDLQRLQSGSTPLTNEEATVAISAAAGRPLVQQKPTGSPNWNPLHLLGAAAADVGEIGKGLITLPKTVAHDMSHIGEMPKAIGRGVSDIGAGNVGTGLQEVAAAPGLQELLLAGSFLVPGGEAVTAGLKGGLEAAGAGVLAAGTAGKALTPQGRQDISQHPLQAFLNVLPAAHGLGITSAATEAAGKLPLVQAAASHATGLLESAGVTRPYREVWRQFSDARKQLHVFASNSFAKAMETFGGRSLPEMQQITQLITRGKPEELAAAEVQFPGIGEMKASYDALQEKTADSGPYLRIANPETGITDVYATASLPAKYQRYLEKQRNTAASLTEQRQATIERVTKSRQALADSVPPDPKQISEQLKPLVQEDFKANGADGLLVQASERLSRGAYEDAARLLHQAAHQDPAFGQLGDQLSSVREKRQAFGAAQREKHLAEQKAIDLSKRVVEHKVHVTAAESALRSSLKLRPAARWHPNIGDEFHQKLEAWATDFYSGDPAKLHAALEDVGNRYYTGTFADGTPVIPKDALNTYLREASAKVSEWQKQGWNPSFVHTVTEGQARSMRYPQMYPRTEPTPSSFKEKMVNPAPSEEGANVAISLTHQQTEIYMNQLWHQAMTGWEDPQLGHQKGWLERFGRTRGELVDELRQRGLAGHEAEAQVRAEWTNPQKYGGSQGRTIFANRDQLLIPTHLAKNFDRLVPSSKDWGKFKGFFDKGTRGYRFAVTGLSPQHVVHVFASGAVMMSAAMTDLPTVLRSVGETRRMLKSGEIPTRFLQDASQLPEEDAMLFGSAARNKAQLYMDTVSKGVHPLQRANAAMQHFDEHITRWFKTLDYVSQVKSGLDPEQALYEVGKHFADHAGRSPLERTVFRSLIPFGSWTQHLLRYTFQFPQDHPLRAGIIANLATAEFADNQSGLPRDFAQLFFLGDHAIDIRSFNPFRDINRDFSLPGFISSLNPAAEAVFTSLGINVLTGSQQLYPELTVDPNTGKLVTKRGDYLKSLGEAMVPQVQGIEALLGWSDTMRQLKKNDPSAYRYTLARYLHFPWLPRTINLPKAKATEELNLFKVAQQAESQALKTGDFSQASQYNLLPFQGSLQSPQALQALYKLLQNQNTGFTPSTLLRR